MPNKLLSQLTVLLLGLLLSSWTFAQDSSQDKRPTIAVVLAGGGAKGAAHVGVLKALEEMQIPVDIITGASMGAYFGGLYSTGMSADELEGFIYSVDWNSGYIDRVSRSQRRIRNKEIEDRYQIRTDFGLSSTGITVPSGVVQGQNMLAILRESTGNVGRVNSFDDFPIRYRAMATDIVTLEQVIIEDGYLVDAMMASMSVPGVLPPYELQDRLLVDGGVTNNMPVDLAKEMGADVVIAIDISTDYQTKEQLTDLFTVANQLSNYIVRRTTQEQAALLTEQDIYIRPDVGSMETTEFDKMGDAYDKGYQAAIQLKEQLQHLSLNGSDYQIYIDKKQQAQSLLHYGDQLTVNAVTIDNNTHYDDKTLSEMITLEPNQVHNTQKLEKQVEELYALDRFERVSYKHQKMGGNDATVVEFSVDEKSWGPNYLDFRFFLEDDFTTDSQYAIGLTANFTGLTDTGGELRTSYELGTDKFAKVAWYSPISSNQKVFYETSISYEDRKRTIPLTGFEDIGLDASEFSVPADYQSTVVELGLGYQRELWTEFKLGFRFTDGYNDIEYDNTIKPFTFQRYAGFAGYKLDTLDHYSFPTKGHYIDAEYRVSYDTGEHEPNSIVDDTFDDDTSYEIDFSAKTAHSYDKHTLVGNLDLELFINDNAFFPVEPKELGGFLNLSGVPRNSLLGQNKFFTSMVYRYRWFDNDFGLFSSPFYVGGSLEYGGVWSDPDIDPSDIPMFVAGSVFAGVDSPIGPMMFSYGRTEQGYDSFYLVIGTSFR
ncbi:patatin-like phospholipase family protein [Vibrio maerlii]|uniref:patatin-like phospholipase family protein n=1 Tax=Vibrio maerlii TaxID=2231648 RepID=UPI000E3D19D4|nr:patatin-like phospholipase family protein [Vibrio maerlii]